MENTISMHGRRLRAVSDTIGGEVSTETLFEFSQEGDLVWARYTGGQVRLGFLVGTMTGTLLNFRYTQVNRAGETSTGHSQDQIELLPDGRVRLHEQWAWDSHEGSGTSTLEEVVPQELSEQEPYIILMTPRALWEQGQAEAYRSESLESEGFIHCSKVHQAVAVANARFSHRNDMLLLVVDTARVVSLIVYEGKSAELYPHIYGPLNRDAVIAIYNFQPDQDGKFHLPEAVLTQLDFKKRYAQE